MTTEASVTPGQARLWLAGLTMPCPDTNHIGARCSAGCNMTGKVPVLDLREPCRQIHMVYTSKGGSHKGPCAEVGCPGWRPKQGREALHEAMLKDGWDVHTHQYASREYRSVVFYKRIKPGDFLQGQDAEDNIAAMKAMQAAGYV